jgi:hypothetical protein
MSVHATVTFFGVGSSSSTANGTDTSSPATGTYGISLFVSVYNDDPSILEQTSLSFNGSNSIQVPYALSPKKADKFIRETISDAILAGVMNSDTTGWLIHPDDIYFPMTN